MAADTEKLEILRHIIASSLSEIAGFFPEMPVTFLARDKNDDLASIVVSNDKDLMSAGRCIQSLCLDPNSTQV